VSLVLAVDQGTTGSRAIVFDRSGRTVTYAYEEFTQHFTRTDMIENDHKDN